MRRPHGKSSKRGSRLSVRACLVVPFRRLQSSPMPGQPLPDAEKLLEALTDKMRPEVGPETGLIGIHTGGVWLAERLHQALGIKAPLGTLDISFYRDDYRKKGLKRNVKASDIPFDVEGRPLILVDDVL